MYSKSEASAIKKKFWTTFGMYMKPVKNAEGDTINWINYKTGIRHLYFRMDADKKKASVAIEIKHPQITERLIFFDKLQSLKDYFHDQLQEEWNWQQTFYDEDGAEASRIVTVLEGINIFRKEHWPAIISFLKERIIKLDAFWNDVKFQFEV
ncbi:MAG: DUF4268 domain-containing protein [Niabella sp.]